METKGPLRGGPLVLQTLKHGGKEEAEDLRECLFSYGCRKLILVVQDSFDAISQVNNIEIK